MYFSGSDKYKREQLNVEHFSSKNFFFQGNIDPTGEVH